MPDMTRWEITHVDITYNLALADGLLAEGWEPFAVTTTSSYGYSATLYGGGGGGGGSSVVPRAGGAGTPPSGGSGGSGSSPRTILWLRRETADA